MSAYKHGVYGSEIATSVLPPVSVDAGIPMIVGTAPVSMADAGNVNKAVLCHTFAEAVAAFGYVPPKTDSASGLKKFEYSICEMMYSAFSLFGVSPIIVVNVLNPSTHQSSISASTVTIGADGSGTVAETGVIPTTVSLSSGDTTYVRGTDYEVAFDDNGNLVINGLRDSSGDLLIPTGSLTISASACDPSKVTASDIIGGIGSDGAKKGFELIDDVFPKFGVVPGTLLAPGFSGNSGVAAVMAAKCTGINGLFKCISVVDVPTSTVTKYDAVKSWKDTNNISSTYQVACWPMLALDGVAINMSTEIASLMALVDSENDDVPYVSPSNHALQMDATVLADGSEVWLNNETASYLNSQGIVTAQNFIGGWKCWGNRCACYPGNTDAKDALIPIRRMFNWTINTLVQTYWSRVDAPMNKRLIQTIVDSCNIWLNGLSARGYIIGGHVEFDESENPVTSLLDGIMTYHVYITPPAPAREIDFVVEYDVNNLSSLFE